MSDSIKSKHASPFPLTDNILNEKFKLSTKPSPSLFSKCITAISNTITSIYGAISGKTQIRIIYNPTYQEESPLFTIKREEDRLVKLESIIQANSIMTPEDIEEYNQLKQGWEQNKTVCFGPNQATLEEAQAMFDFYKADLDKHPDFFKKVMPTILEILDRPEIYNKSIDDLATMAAGNISYVDMETYDLNSNNQQDNSDFQYVKLLITSEYKKYKEAIARAHATETPVEKAQRLYMMNKEAMDTDDALSDNDLKILYEINYLVSSLISDPQFAQQEGVLRQSGVKSKSATLTKNIETQNFNSPTFQLEDAKTNSIISAIKQLQSKFLTLCQPEVKKMAKQLNDFEKNNQIKPLYDLDHITRICMPMYSEIVKNEKVNKMSIENVAQITAELYQYAYPTDPADTVWRATATKFVQAVISRGAN